SLSQLPLGGGALLLAQTTGHGLGNGADLRRRQTLGTAVTADRRVDNLVQGQIEHVVAVTGVHHHLGAAAHHLLQGIQVETLAGDFRGLLILRKQIFKALGLTLGLGNHLGLVGIGFLDYALGLTPGLGNDPVGIGLGLTDHPFLVLSGLDHVVVGLLDLGGRLGVLSVVLHHIDAGFI